MTALCAIHWQGETWIGNDRMVVYGGILIPSERKWTIHKNQWAIGLSGETSASQVLERNCEALLGGLNYPMDVAPRLFAAFKAAGFELSPAKNCASPDCGQYMMLANPEGVWLISGDFAVLKVKDFWAQGSGGDIALGAMEAAMEAPGATPESVIDLGLRAAGKWSVYCGETNRKWKLEYGNN